MDQRVIDTQRYPIDRLDSPGGRALVASCASRFDRDGLCLLPGFVRPQALAQMTAEARALTGSTFFCRNSHTAYLTEPDPALSAAHPRNRLLYTEVGSIANDLLAPDGVLQGLYDWQPLTDFIADVVGQPRLYRSADPLGALSVNVFAPGGSHAWHFDEARFTVTLMLQPAEGGGEFEYVTDLRDEAHDDTAAIGRILDGERRDVVQMPFEPGTLSVFGGRHTLHRVTRVTGTGHRLVPVLTYDSRPDSINSDAVRALFWGRTQARSHP